MSIFKRREMDLTEGSILKKMIVFAIPIVIASLLQTLFHMADTFVLGMFAENGDLCVGAVSTTGSLINMIVSLFVGLAVGANVMVARYIGAKNHESVKNTIGTSVCLSFIFGAILVLVGIFGSRTILLWTGVSDLHIDLATNYLTIYLCGAPFMLLYNYCANILRASGDTVTSTTYITIGGVINVVLNIILVVLTPFDVEGVAIATVACNAFASIACFLTLLKSNTNVKFEWKYCKIYKKEFSELLKVGIPSGINSCLFGFSNTLTSAAINELGIIYGAHVVTGSGYANQFDNVIYVAMNAIAISGQAFVSQNLGAKNFERIKRTLFVTLGIVSVVGVVVSGIMLAITYPLIFAISGSELVAQATLEKTVWIGAFYTICGVMEVLSFYLRGLGKSLTGMIVTLIGTMIFRAIWIWFIFPLNKTTDWLYCMYPITWVITVAIFIVVVAKTLKDLRKQLVFEEKVKSELDGTAKSNA